MVKLNFHFIRKISIVILILLLNTSVFSQDITIRAFTDTTDYQVGDYIYYTVEVNYNKQIAVFTPDIKKSISNVDVISEEPPLKKETGDQLSTSYKFVLSRYDSAEVTIPPVPVKYKMDIDTASRAPFIAEADTTLSTVYSNPVNFRVHLVQINAEEDIKDIKGPERVPPDLKIIALWIAAGLVLASLSIYLYKRYRKKKVSVVVPEKRIAIPPDIKALENLKKLDNEHLWQKGAIKEYHSRITEIVRNYFEERFELPALELSTTEVIFHMHSHPDAAPVIELTSSFLHNADLVKFAKFIPVNNLNEEMMIQAVEIVKITAKPKPAAEEINV